MRFTRKITFVVAVLCALGALQADDALDRATRKQRMYERTGGMLWRPGSGTIAVVNLQRRVSSDRLAAKIEQFSSQLRVEVTLNDSNGPFKLADVASDMKSRKALVGIYLVEDETLPMSLVALEAKWAVVNVAVLAADSPPPEQLEARVKKMIVRATATLLGAGISRNKDSVMRYCSSVSELDDLRNDNMLMDSLVNVLNSMNAFGFRFATVSSYRQACQEGWANKPTNDVQKVIWEEVMSEKERGPTRPLTIQYRKK